MKKGGPQMEILARVCQWLGSAMVSDAEKVADPNGAVADPNGRLEESTPSACLGGGPTTLLRGDYKNVQRVFLQIYFTCE